MTGVGKEAVPQAGCMDIQYSIMGVMDGDTLALLGQAFGDLTGLVGAGSSVNFFL